jgi:hypothetical protein
MGDELERIGLIRYYAGICLEGLKKITKILGVDRL